MTMLRKRPEICPVCHADVRGRLLCERCGEALPGIAPRPRAAAVPLAIALLALAWGLYRVQRGGAADVALGTVHLAAAAILFARCVRRPVARLVQSVAQLRGHSGTTSDRADGEVLVRGRVRAVLGYRLDDAISAEGRGEAVQSGRFVVEGEHEAALVDDDCLCLGPFTYCIRDGDEVEVRGPARRAEVVEGGDDRGQKSRWVLDGSVQSPVVVSAVSWR